MFPPQLVDVLGHLGSGPCADGQQDVSIVALHGCQDAPLDLAKSLPKKRADNEQNDREASPDGKVQIVENSSNCRKVEFAARMGSGDWSNRC